MTCEPIDIIYFTLGTGNYEFKCYERSYGILGKPYGAVTAPYVTKIYT